MSRLWKPSRRLFLAGGAGLIASPAIAQLTMTGVGGGSPASGGGGGTTFVVDQTPAPKHFAAGVGTGGNYPYAMPAIAANSLCIISFAQFTPTAPIASVIDTTAGITWTAAGQDGNNGGLFYGFYSSSQTAGNNLDITMTGSASDASLVFASFTGASSALLDSGATFTQGGVNTPTWTTSVAKTLAVGMVETSSGTETPSTAGWVSLGNSTAFIYLVYKITSGTLSSETLGTDSSGGYLASRLAAFK